MNAIPVPVGDPIAQKSGLIGNAFLQWLQWLVGLVMRAPIRMTPDVNLTAQAASVSATGLAPVQFSGVYRLSYYVRVTRAATTTSSIAITFGFTDTLAQTVSSAALTGNTTTTWGTGTYLVWIDGGTTPTYATTYASTGATSMQYKLSVVVEMVNA